MHHLVVMDQYGLASVIDDRTVAAHWPAGGAATPHEVTIGPLVEHGVACVPPDEPAAAVARVMTAGRCDAVPVVSATGVLLGLVTATDIVAAVARTAVPVAAAPRSDALDDRG